MSAGPPAKKEFGKMGNSFKKLSSLSTSKEEKRYNQITEGYAYHHSTQSYNSHSTYQSYRRIWTLKVEDRDLFGPGEWGKMDS